MTPMTGFHSVIDRPERVSRVIPPTITIAKIRAQQANSHAATAPCLAFSVAAAAAPGLAIVENDTRRSCENDRLHQNEGREALWQPQRKVCSRAPGEHGVRPPQLAPRGQRAPRTASAVASIGADARATAQVARR